MLTVEKKIENRRLFTRYGIDASAGLVLHRDSTHPLILKDLSVRGAGVMMDFPLKANDFVAMDIPANFFLKERLHRLARVAWCSKI
nr:PilZ domain-containing protein [Candidatus Omnitrophota bacterium]